jgi:hypothetical protein
MKYYLLVLVCLVPTLAHGDALAKRSSSVRASVSKSKDSTTLSSGIHLGIDERWLLKSSFSGTQTVGSDSSFTTKIGANHKFSSFQKYNLISEIARISTQQNSVGFLLGGDFQISEINSIVLGYGWFLYRDTSLRQRVTEHRISLEWTHDWTQDFSASVGVNQSYFLQNKTLANSMSLEDRGFSFSLDFSPTDIITLGLELSTSRIYLGSTFTKTFTGSLDYDFTDQFSMGLDVSSTPSAGINASYGFN